MQPWKKGLMQIGVVFLVVSVTLSSQLFAVLRPHYPVKASPPLGGNVIVIGDDRHRDPAKHFPGTAGSDALANPQRQRFA
jgi:hypothetical protein